MNLDRLTDEVLRRILECRPRALLIGRAPDGEDHWTFVEQSPYEQVVIGILPPGELLLMPSDPVCRALLDGMPVYLYPQPYGKGGSAGVLRRELAAAQQRLLRLGVRPVPRPGSLVTAQDLRQWDAALPADARLTPLAREVLEGKIL